MGPALASSVPPPAMVTGAGAGVCCSRAPWHGQGPLCSPGTEAGVPAMLSQFCGSRICDPGKSLHPSATMSGWQSSAVS